MYNDIDYYEEEYGYDNAYYYDKTKHPRYKTEMCRNMDLYGECTFEGCTFAHLESELRKIKNQTKN